MSVNLVSFENRSNFWLDKLVSFNDRGCLALVMFQNVMIFAAMAFKMGKTMQTMQAPLTLHNHTIPCPTCPTHFLKGRDHAPADMLCGENDDTGWCSRCKSSDGAWFAIVSRL